MVIKTTLNKKHCISGVSKNKSIFVINETETALFIQRVLIPRHIGIKKEKCLQIFSYG